MHRFYCGSDKYLQGSQAEKVFVVNVLVDAMVLNLAGKLLKVTDCSKYRFQNQVSFVQAAPAPSFQVI